MPATATVTVQPMIELRTQLAQRLPEFANALPSHISPQHFERATLTAVAQNPKLVNVDRRSLFNALMRCAQDGLLPDGRQAALVIFRDRERGEIAQYMPMVQGIRKLVQQGGEITRFEQTVVFHGDEFELRLGDHPEILHRPALKDRGAPVLVYSIAQFRDGTISREVMTVEEIEKVRAVSKTGDSGPWRDWWGEMARKTVAKRHAKVLPMSNDAMAAIDRDNAAEFNFPSRGLAPLSPAPERRPRLAERLDAIDGPQHRNGGEASTPPKRRRGRPRNDEAALEQDEQQTSAPEMPAFDDGQTDIEDVIERTGSPPQQPEQGNSSADYETGVADAKAGRQSCLNRDIRENPRRFDEWTAGYRSVVG